MNYVVYYDILKARLGVEVEVLVLVLCALAGVFLLGRGLKRWKTFEIILFIIWLIGFAGLGSFGFGNVYHQHNQCQQWARSGDYQVVEGLVINFIPYNRTYYEQFSVQNVHFEYSQYDLSVCGFRQTASEGSPIKDGLLVRIAYKNGRILKLEIAENQ